MYRLLSESMPSMQLCLQGSRSFRGVQDPSTTVLRVRVGILTCSPSALNEIWLLSVARLKLVWERSLAQMAAAAAIWARARIGNSGIQWGFLGRRRVRHGW